jgi:hypothetical protein
MSICARKDEREDAELAGLAAVLIGLACSRGYRALVDLEGHVRKSELFSARFGESSNAHLLLQH